MTRPQAHTAPGARQTATARSIASSSTSSCIKAPTCSRRPPGVAMAPRASTCARRRRPRANTSPTWVAPASPAPTLHCGSVLVGAFAPLAKLSPHRVHIGLGQRLAVNPPSGQHVRALPRPFSQVENHRWPVRARHHADAGRERMRRGEPDTGRRRDTPPNKSCSERAPARLSCQDED
jgi:hypothetical protein